MQGSKLSINIKTGVVTEELIDVPPISLEQAKIIAVTTVKKIATQKISTIIPDWKLERHMEQVTLQVTTDLTNEEYLEVLNKKQAIRKASNQIEAEINVLQTTEEIQNYDIANHPKWPK